MAFEAVAATLSTDFSLKYIGCAPVLDSMNLRDFIATVASVPAKEEFMIISFIEYGSM
ncbi:hypothetical protein DHBDCA_p1795 [Dehalobacter sp. DCA]|nr:hypothetical protein DHBDCA_p1795 [Dehalobacter sp. DCA]AFV05807.1 hypothetical protein DCF50_p1805 [Dehalobacter sp. CF]